MTENQKVLLLFLLWIGSYVAVGCWILWKIK